MRAGPILTVVAEWAFDRVYVFTTPKAAEICGKTAEAIMERHPGMTVEIPAILQSTPPEFVPEGHPFVREIDIHQKDFPSITRSVEPRENRTFRQQQAGKGQCPRQW